MIGYSEALASSFLLQDCAKRLQAAKQIDIGKWLRGF